MNLRKISPKIKLILSLEIVVIIISSILSFFVWSQMDFWARESSRKKAMAIASTAAAMTDPERHEKILSEDDRKSNSYKKLQTLYRNIMDSNTGMVNIYSMRMSDAGVWTYVVSGYQTRDQDGNGIVSEDEKGPGIGEVFNATNFPEVKNAFDGPTADKNYSCNQVSCWLSGYAPIKDKYGQSIAITVTKIKVYDVISFEKKEKKMIELILGLIFIIFPAITYFLLKIFINDLPSSQSKDPSKASSESE